MLITKIERQKKNKSRWSIFLDGEFGLGVSEDTILKFGLRTNDELSDEAVKEIKDYDEFTYGKKAALDFLSYRQRSVKEIMDKLKKKLLSSASVEKVITHLEKLGLIDDLAFAKEFISTKLRMKPNGRRVLNQKLMEKGISKEVREKVLADTFEKVDEKELALQNFNKYYPRIKDKERLEQKKKVFDYLVRKGFDFDTVNQVIRENLR